MPLHGFDGFGRLRSISILRHIKTEFLVGSVKSCNHHFTIDDDAIIALTEIRRVTKDNLLFTIL
ncbi:Uncharacterised protein [Vibrio cholerae]|uniref:Uncharacterized protein n=1 Tax=Vibrio cholerae TaxID=666 RepID=A0A655Z9A3_VIBCL|nr:Uncharacterised protein [Vibrio cholerae]CSC07475.1 Uncharacterised protein [Vibrio cholerae]CSC61494.1 Uncharacterised protein [Vibrio cholerae]